MGTMTELQALETAIGWSYLQHPLVRLTAHEQAVDILARLSLIGWALSPIEHICDPRTCGEDPCTIGSSGWPVRDTSANGIDGEAPCDCEAHGV